MSRYTPKLKEKRWDPALEEKIIEIWEKERLYQFNINSGKPVFSIDTPPPYASGKPHMGFAYHYASIDSIARYMRMKGYEVLFPMGIDRNGLPVEVQVEKIYKIRMMDTPREKFIELCKKLLDEYEREILALSRRLGFSMNSLHPDEVYRTDSPEYRAITQATFIELWRRGLIYEAERPNNWCPRCQTTLADAEVEYTEEMTELVYIRFPLKDGKGKFLTIATTRPELLCACRAVLVHPDDERYKDLHNKYVIVPIYNREVPIIPHKEVDPKFGTGVMMLCSFGDTADIRLFRELQLKPIRAIDTDAKMTDAAGKYKGLSVTEARKEIIKDLKEQGFVEKIETISHKVPICWRCKTRIEFITMKEYYLKQRDYLEELRKIIEEIEFHPKHHKQILVNWIDSVKSDWPISRRRYYGTEVPLWYCENGHVILPEAGKYYQPWKDDPPVDKCPVCGSTNIKGEWRTFDTWFDSSISALFISGYLRKKDLFQKAFPVGIRPQGKEIVRTWLYYTLLRVYQLLKKPAFKHVWISGLVMDEHGRKMSKSLGNIIYPEPFIEKYGADALRFAGAAETRLGADIMVSEKRIAGAAKFIQKLYSIARFISLFPEPRKDDVELQMSDRWILAELNSLIKRVKELYDDFDFFAVNYIRDFVWDIFADHYIEMVKSRAYGSETNSKAQKAAWWTLHYVLKTVLKLLAPVTPFITDYLYRELYGRTVHLEQFPEPEEVDTKLLEYTKWITSINSAIWKAKKSRKLSLRSPIKKLYLPKLLEPFKEDLKSMHNAEEIIFTPPTEGEKIEILGEEIGIVF